MLIGDLGIKKAICLICIFALAISSLAPAVSAGEDEYEHEEGYSEEIEEEYSEESHSKEKATYSEIESIQFEGETITSESSQCTVVEGEKYKITIISEERYTVEKISLIYDREVFEEYKSADYSGDRCYKYLKVKDGAKVGNERIKVRMLDDRGRSIDSEEIKCYVDEKDDKYDKEDKYDKKDDKYDNKDGKYDKKDYRFDDKSGEDYGSVVISIKSPEDTEIYRKVVFSADAGLSKSEERKRLKFHWTIEGDNLKRDRHLYRNGAMAQLNSGDYCVRLKVTDKWTGEEHEEEKYFSVEYQDRKQNKYNKKYR